MILYMKFHTCVAPDQTPGIVRRQLDWTAHMRKFYGLTPPKPQGGHHQSKNPQKSSAAAAGCFDDEEDDNDDGDAPGREASSGSLAIAGEGDDGDTAGGGAASREGCGKSHKAPARGPLAKLKRQYEQVNAICPHLRL